MTTLIKPFRALRPTPEHASDVAAPPYDVLNTEEARQRAAGRPLSFLHISKPEIDLPPDTEPYAPAVYETGAANLQQLVEDGVLIRDAEPCYYAYRLRMDDHVQTGVVCAGSVADYDTNRIRKHELTRPKKEDDRVRQIAALNAETGPVMVAYRNSDAVKAILDDVMTGAPVYDLVADDGISHTLWIVDDAATDRGTDGLVRRDGCTVHRRRPSPLRVRLAGRSCQARGRTGSTGEEAYNYFLCVAFPHDETQILDYNRVVRDLNGHTPEQLLEEIAKAFDVTSCNEPAKPDQPTQFGMYLNGRWYRLDLHADRIPANDPVASLDVSLLQDNLITPLLGIADQRTDDRIDFVGGIRGLKELERRVDSGEMQAAFALFPTGMEALMAVADAGEVMPPKSTWFEPKLADGLVSHVLD